MGAAVDSPAHGTAGVCLSLDLAKNIRDRLPIQNSDDFSELEAWVTDGDDDIIAANHAQLREFISRGTFGQTEKEFVHSALLRLFTKKFANRSMSWAGAKSNKEFTLKVCKVWELLSDVINAKYPNFQKNMCIYFNNFHKDAGDKTKKGAAGRNHVQRRGDSCDLDSTDGLAEELISAGELQITDVNLSDVEQGE
jgi:hypothetical protein